MKWLKFWLGYSTILFFWAGNVGSYQQDAILVEYFGLAVLIYIAISYNTIMAADKSK